MAGASAESVTIEQAGQTGSTAEAAAGQAPSRWERWLLYLALFLGMLMMVAPFLWMVLGAFKTEAELTRFPPTWIPEELTLAHFRQLFDELDFPTYFKNSVIIAGVKTLTNLFFCSMAGYALAKLHFWGRDVLFVFILGTMMIPGMVTLIPSFIMISELNLVNTLTGVILPGTVGAFGVFLMRQFMLGIPEDLLDAGRIDGASEFHLFWRIALPLSMPALATLAIFTFLASWNDFIWPLIVLSDESKYNLPVALATFAIGQHRTETGMLMAGSLVIILPVLVVFVLLQRYFTQGITMTGLKG
ncbi:MAG: carbohydrate ABC transporter permease [Thermomicrobiales bacterium]